MTNGNHRQRIFVSHFSADFAAVKPMNSLFKSDTTHTVKTEDDYSADSVTELGSSVSSFQCMSVDTKNKRVQFSDESGDELCETFHVESFQDCIGLWWEDHELRQMKADCTQIAKKYRHDEDFCNAIVGVLMHGVSGNESKPDTKTFLDQMRIYQDARGLEPHIVKQSELLADLHHNAVFEAQQEAYERGLIGTRKGDWLICSASAQTSRPFEVLASRLAKHDTREAMRAAFSRWDSESMLKGGRKSNGRSMMGQSASVRCIYS